MTHIVTDECVKCKYTTCVPVCPVDCFYDADMMLVINPDECIDCGVCIDECPVGAISEEKPELIKWIEINYKLSRNPQNRVTDEQAPMKDADKYAQEINKFERYMSK
ncbi:MAG TPA: 4Fe-4S binding protein [Candidatus Megaira endosymbiont of Hartmannula sinica]|nr:4Fe-4S binding protein [Candidatus Megaera endosymbiont of Hartmannula sinica]